MTTFRNRVNGASQTNGTAVTTTNFATGGDGLGANPQKTGTSTCNYDTASPPLSGSAWVVCAPQNGFQSTFYVTITPSNDATWETVFDYTAAPTVANTPFVYARTSTDTRIGEFCIATNGKPNFQASGGGQIAAWTGTALTVGQKRIRVKIHTHATAGAVDWFIYKVSDGSLEMSGSASGVNIATGSQIGRWLHGNNSTTYAVAGNWPAWRYSLFQWADTYTDLGAFPTNSPPNANDGPDHTGVEPYSTVTLSAAASSDIDGTIAAYARTQTSGPTVTLAGATTVTATYEAPATMAGATVVTQLTVTDNLGAASTPDTVTDTVLPHTLWTLAAGGAAAAPLRVTSL